MAIQIKNRDQINKLREAGRLVAQTHQLLAGHIRPGVTTGELDQLAEQFIRKHGGTPSFKGYAPHGAPPFPGTICASLNEVICHGIPSTRRLKEGDIIAIDVGLVLDGWHGDSCVTYPVGKLDATSEQLLEVTRSALNRGIEACGPGKRLGDIGAAIQQYVEAEGFSVVREYTGHGIGRKLHEEPTVLHYGMASSGIMMRPGMVFTIEPMVNVGKATTRLKEDRWTVVTADGSRSAQFEHTIAITEQGVEVLSVL